MKKPGANSAIVDESELLVAQLKKHPILAELADYAMAQGINFLVNPQSEQMIKNGTVTWMFCDFSVFSENESFILIPFDKEKQVIFPESESYQICCLAHELGHSKLKGSRFKQGQALNCPILVSRISKDFQDNCLLKELLANLQAAKLMKTVARTAMRNHAWRIMLLNLWLQCSACLRGVSEGVCPNSRLIARALRALAKSVNSAQKEIAAQLEQRRRVE